jgi:hypothetical protein
VCSVDAQSNRRRLHKNHFRNATWQLAPFVLEGCWALDHLDQATMRWLSKVAKRKQMAVADVIYEAIESFVAKCEAEAELEAKIIKFPTSLKRWQTDHLIPVPRMPSAFHPRAQRVVSIAAMRVNNPDRSSVGINR